mmetsp:Transcript_45731/g.71652  ORF Transcript_45731/g.71652 Transcript_45731/m.71652 type:complete len:215 (+) Transcript_45731:437-1081(+)
MSDSLDSSGKSHHPFSFPKHRTSLACPQPVPHRQRRERPKGDQGMIGVGAAGSFVSLAMLVMGMVLMVEGAGAIECYVGVVKNRIIDGAVERISCPVEVYGDKAACGWACAKDKVSSEDICSFLCMPGHQCGDGGLVHPDSPISPANFMAGCPAQENYEPVENGDLECSARCCMMDGCNSSEAAGSLSCLSGPILGVVFGWGLQRLVGSSSMLD